MRRITVSVLAILIGLPAYATTRLPVVNLGAAGVSARAAFGETAPTHTPKIVSNTVAPANVAATTTAQKPTRTVVARAAAKPASVKQTEPTAAPVASATTAATKPSIDVGEKIAAMDVLVPHRPNSDLWAKSDVPLRMPMPSEISVVRADFDLPEESLDVTPRRVADTQKIASVDTEISRGTTSALDTEIDRLTQLQRRADASTRVATTTATAPSAPVRATVSPRPSVIASAAPAVDNFARSDAPRATGEVTVHRMVVPMDTATDDVIVRSVEKSESPRIAAVRNDMTSLSPSELRKAFRKTYLSENKHLSTYQIDDRFDVASDVSSSIEGFTANRDLSEGRGVRPLEIKISFRGDDSALSRENYNLLTEYAGIVVNNPKRAIQVAIPGRATTSGDARKLAARRLAIVEQVLRDTGVSEQRIMPVLSQRDDDGFVLRIISNDQYETLSKQKRDMFGDTVDKKTFKSLAW
ncbi:hypothetical protein HDR66_00040 [bacterium]|nr:hypothetical protein [bacterium]